MKRRVGTVVLASLPLLLASCSYVRIQNVSEVNATLQVTTPDSDSASTRRVDSGEIVDVFSSHGGPYTVTAIPDEQYQDLLETLRDRVSRRLFEEAESLSADDVAQLVENLNAIDEQLAQLARPGATCGGNVPDFETVFVIVSWDEREGELILSCGSGASE